MKAKKIMFQGHVGNGLEKIDFEKPIDECPHREDCSVRMFGRINCITDYKTCQTYKFYEKHGTKYAEIFR